MATEEQIEAACSAYWEQYRDAWRPIGLLTETLDVPFAELPGRSREMTAAAVRAALEAAEAAAWEPIGTAPTFGRVLVAGWQKASGSSSGYWWVFEDETDEYGVPVSHPAASKWRPLPTPPEASE